MTLGDFDAADFALSGIVGLASLAIEKPERPQPRRHPLLRAVGKLPEALLIIENLVASMARFLEKDHSVHFRRESREQPLLVADPCVAEARHVHQCHLRRVRVGQRAKDSRLPHGKPRMAE